MSLVLYFSSSCVWSKQNIHFEKAAIILAYCWKQNESQIFVNCIFTIFKTTKCYIPIMTSLLWGISEDKVKDNRNQYFIPKTGNDTSSHSHCLQTFYISLLLSEAWLSLFVRGYSTDPLLVTREGMRLYWWYPFKETVRRKKKKPAIKKKPKKPNLTFACSFYIRIFFCFRQRKESGPNGIIHGDPIGLHVILKL